MAVGKSGRSVDNSIPGHQPREFASRVAAHIHPGTPDGGRTVSGPGATTPPGNPSNTGPALPGPTGEGVRSAGASAS